MARAVVGRIDHTRYLLFLHELKRLIELLFMLLVNLDFAKDHSLFTDESGQIFSAASFILACDPVHTLEIVSERLIIGHGVSSSSNIWQISFAS
jgi:hypothetical protein